MINEKNVKNSKLRDQFEKFLNKYNISHISFNFLGNELFNKTITHSLQLSQASSSSKLIDSSIAGASSATALLPCLLIKL